MSRSFRLKSRQDFQDFNQPQTHTDKHKQVIPAKAGIHALGLDLRLCADKAWMPACAGMTVNTPQLFKYEFLEATSESVPFLCGVRVESSKP